MVESCLVLGMLCLILFGILQVSYLVAARDVVTYSAMAAGRSAQVGFNDTMVERVVRVVGIPAAGPIITPRQGSGSGRPLDSGGTEWDRAVARSPGSWQYWDERALIPLYLGAAENDNPDAILDYDNWQEMETRIGADAVSDAEATDELLEIGVRQGVPLVLPFSGFFGRLLPGLDRIQVYRSDTRGLAENAWDSAERPGRFEVPAMPMEESVRLENHAAYYMERP